jgi:hypothetical protein
MTVAMNAQVEDAIRLMLGKRCCRQRVWRPRTLSLGFGDKVYHGNPKLVDTFYGEWEIGTFYCAWRVTQQDRILCGSTDAVDSLDELDAALKRIDFGCIQSLTQPTQFDVRAEFDTGIAVEFLATTSDDDECFHIYCPQSICVTFSIQEGWTIGRSDKPMNQTDDNQ